MFYELLSDVSVSWWIISILCYIECIFIFWWRYWKTFLWIDLNYYLIESLYICLNNSYSLWRLTQVIRWINCCRFLRFFFTEGSDLNESKEVSSPGSRKSRSPSVESSRSGSRSKSRSRSGSPIHMNGSTSPRKSVSRSRSRSGSRPKSITSNGLSRSRSGSRDSKEFRSRSRSTHSKSVSPASKLLMFY